MALSDGLSAFWNLSDTADATGNGRTLSAVGTPTFGAGKIGNCATCSGANYLSIADHASLRGGDRDFTIAGWFNITEGDNTAAILGKGDGGGSARIEYYLKPELDQIQFAFDGAGGPSGVVSGLWVEGQWHFFCARHDAANDLLKLTIDTTTQQEATAGNAPPTTTNELRLGNAEAVGAFDGKLDAVGFWTRYLSDAEVVQLRNAGTGVEYPLPSASSHKNLLLLGVG